MNTFLIVTLLVILGLGAIYLLMRNGTIEDKDGNNIPDVIEDKVEEVVKETKRRAKRVKEEVQDVKKAAKEVVKQSKDVVDAAKGQKRRGRKPKAQN